MRNRAKLPLLVAVTALNGQPSGAAAGFSLNGDVAGTSFGWHLHDAGMLYVKSPSGTSITVRIWLYCTETAAWHPAGVNSTVTSRGVLNDGNAITVDGAAVLAHNEPIQFLSGADRIYAELVANTGGTAAVDCYLVSCARQVAV
jgi:hypothetical protein